MKSSKAYKMLSSEVQSLIPSEWTGLNVVQEESIIEVIDGKGDIIIQAPTSSGKTEAAFLPTINQTYKSLKKEVKILYISPLIALINDQEKRLNNFLNKNQDHKIKVTKWHSEVSKNIKDNFLKNPKGVLIITPESLESILVNNKGANIFKNIEYYILDEFHDFLGGIRGDQLRSILGRLDEISKHKPRKILLSATLNDSNKSCQKWLKPTDTEPKTISSAEYKQKPLKGKIYYFKEGLIKEGLKIKYYKELAKITNEKKHLIFGNTKSSLEFTLDTFKKWLSTNKKNQGLELGIHHGSLSKKFKNEVEERLKQKNHIAVFSSSTLEMGIDISNIHQVSLIDPPFSVASFVQRIGRSGRTKDSNIIFNMFPHMVQSSNSHYKDLKTKLIQSIALFELHKENWVEPKEFQTFTYSVCVHQILAFTAQEREVTKQDLWDKIVEPNFSKEGITVSEDDFVKMIDCLIDRDYLADKQGPLAIGEKGNELVKNMNFYSVFSSNPVWNLRNCKDETSIGTVARVQKLKLKDALLFAGRNWRVKSIHDRKSLIYLEEISNFKKLPKFISSGGSIHKKVHEKMLEIYKGNKIYDYLNMEGNLALKEARESYFNHTLLNSDFTPMFMGSQITEFISFLLKQEGVSKPGDEIVPSYIGLHSSAITTERMKEFLRKRFSTREQVGGCIKELNVSNLFLEKYDYLLPRSILEKSYIDHRICFKDYELFLQDSHNYKKAS